VTRQPARFILPALLLSLPVLPARAADDVIRSDTGSVTVHAIRHATFVLEWSGHTIAVDPVGGAAAFEGYPTPDLVLITDVHGDHLDPDTLKRVAGEGTAIMAPPAVAEKLGEVERGRTTVLENGEKTEVAGVGVEAIPMYNLTEERNQFHPRGRGNGYVLTLGGLRIYVSGDTEDISEMRVLKGIDAAFLCMNLPYTMSVEQAADAVLAFRPRIVYPYHYRGKGGLSDVGKFEKLVSKDPKIEVRQLDWYGG
jgi:L-ascorbate metabolism protein UlaG (beta-lactamase superfamily)